MQWDINSDSPVYAQLVAIIRQAIVSGHFTVGERLPSVRDLALSAKVNPNTMQKALTELEREGLIYSQRTAGRFVTDDISKIENARDSLAKKLSADFIENMAKLGYDSDKIIEILKINLEKEVDL